MSLPSIVRRSKPPFPICEFAGLSCATRLELIASWEGRFTPARPREAQLCGSCHAFVSRRL